MFPPVVEARRPENSLVATSATGGTDAAVDSATDDEVASNGRIRRVFGLDGSGNQLR
jgi:hypothetical protein